jgi:hypothetical protein
MCSRQLAEFATLDAEVVEHKVLALRCDVGRIDIDPPGGLRRRIAIVIWRGPISLRPRARLRCSWPRWRSAAAGDAAKAVRAALARRQIPVEVRQIGRIISG